MTSLGTANLNGQSYELRRVGQSFAWYHNDVVAGPGSGLDGHQDPTEAVDALWSYLGLRAAPEGWWQPAEGVEVDISAARLPRTVTERDRRLGQELSRQLEEAGLQVTAYRGRGEVWQDLALAYRIVEPIVLEVRAEELLEQLAVEHEIECELVEGSGEWLILGPGDDRAPMAETEPLAVGDTPLDAAEELRRELEAPDLAELEAPDLAELRRQLARAQTTLQWFWHKVAPAGAGPDITSGVAADLLSHRHPELFQL
jgi:hypothetical protein